MLRNLVRRCRRCGSGASAVEFALVAPVFLLMLFGILVYGQYLSLTHSVQQLAAEAARQSLGGLDTAERAALADAYLEANAQFYPLVDVHRLQVSAAPASDDPDIFVVTLSYNLKDTLFDIVPQFLKPRPVLVASAAIERGGY